MKNITSIEDKRSLVDSFDNFILDCDGVIWRGSNLIPNVKETLEFLESKGKNIFYLTNNATRSRKQYVDKFSKLGMTPSPDNIYTSSYATALYLSSVPDIKSKNHPDATGSVYIVGMDGIAQELSLMGIPYSGATNDAKKEYDFSEPITENIDPSVRAIVVGYDLHFNYYKMACAVASLQNAEVHFVASNTDATFPSQHGILPGGGTFVSAITTAAGREPVVVGKPNTLLVDRLIQAHHLDRSRTCMVGDRLETDILMGKRANIATIAVLTGVVTRDRLAGIESDSDISPQYILTSLGELFDASQ